MTTLTILAADGSSDVHTITKTEWELERAKSDEVHVVLHQPRAGCE